MTSGPSHRADVTNPGREPGVARAGVTDLDLKPISQKVENGERLTREDGLTLFNSPDLQTMKDAGVTSLPGGGAEVFSPAARATIADKKLTGDEWLAVHREAHQLGLPSNCTMLYGHVESMEDRVDHLLALRALQDDSGGFLTYMLLGSHPDHNELGETLGRTGTATTG